MHTYIYRYITCTVQLFLWYNTGVNSFDCIIFVRKYFFCSFLQDFNSTFNFISIDKLLKLRLSCTSKEESNMLLESNKVENSSENIELNCNALFFLSNESLVSELVLSLFVVEVVAYCNCCSFIGIVNLDIHNGMLSFILAIGNWSKNVSAIIDQQLRIVLSIEINVTVVIL